MYQHCGQGQLEPRCGGCDNYRALAPNVRQGMHSFEEVVTHVLVHSLAWPQATHHLLSNKVIELKRIK